MAMKRNLFPLAALALLTLVVLLVGGTPLGVGRAEAAIAFRAAAQAGATGSSTIAFRAAASAAADSGVLTLTINKPTGTVQDDVMVASIGHRPATATVTPPSGWTLVRDVRNTTGSGPPAVTVYRKVAGASEPANYAWTFSSSTGSAGGIQTFSGVDTTTPVDVENGAPTAAAYAHATPSVITTVANTMLVTSYFTGNRDLWANPPTWGGTEGFQARAAVAPAMAEGSFALQAAIGATGTKTETDLGPDAADTGAAHILALRPGGANLTITKPTGTVLNDVMIASIAVRPNTVAITPPAGWTLVRRMDNAVATANSLAVYSKVAGASEPANYTWALVSTHTGVAGGIQSFSGVDTATPIDVENGQNTPNGTAHATPSVTTTLANTMLVTSHGVSNPGPNHWTPPAGMTEAFDATGGSEAIEGNYVLQAAAGSTGAKSATSAVADSGNAHILALRPICAVAVSEAAYVAANAQPAQAIVYWSSSDAALILRKSGSSITDLPANGTSYTAGNTIGASTVIYDGSGTIANVTCTGTSCTNTSLSASTTYYYKVFAKSGTCYSPAGTEVNARQEAGAYPPWSYMMSSGSTMRAGIAGEGSLNSAGNFGRIISLNTSTGTQYWAPVATNGAVQSWLSWLPIGDLGVRSVQTNTVTMPVGATGTTQTVNVGAAQGFAGVTDLTKSVLFFSLKVNSNNPDDGQVRGQLTSPSNIQFVRADDTSLSAVTIRWYVVEFMGGVHVQRGTIVATNTSTATIITVDTNKSFTLISCSVETGDATYGNDDYFRARLVNSTTLEVVQNTIGTKTCDWQVVWYAGASVQRGIGTLASAASSSGAIAITPVDPTKSFLQVTWKTDNNGTGANSIEATLTGGGASITIARDVTGTTIDYAWEVVSFTDGATVQSGTELFGSSSIGPETDVLSSVDLTRSVPLLSAYQRVGRHAYTADDNVGPGWITVTITDPTTVTMEREITGSVAADTAWFVMQFPAQSTATTLIGGDQSGRVYSVNSVTGATNWSVDLRTLPGGDPTTVVQAPVAAQLRKWSDAAFTAAQVDDLLFAATRNTSASNNKVFALRASDGSVAWTFSPGNMDYIVGMPWVDYARNRVYVVSRSNGNTQASLWAINTLNGSLVASRNLNDIEASPTMSYDGNTLYIGNLAGTLYAIDLTSPTLANKWSYPLGASYPLKGFVWQDWNDPQYLYFSTGGDIVWSLQDNGGSASLRWAAPVTNPSTPLPTADRLYVGSSDGKVHQLRLTDGCQSPNPSCPGYTAYTVGDGAYQVGDVSTETLNEIFVPTTEGKLYKLPLPLP